MLATRQLLFFQLILAHDSNIKQKKIFSFNVVSKMSLEQVGEDDV